MRYIRIGITCVAFVAQAVVAQDVPCPGNLLKNGTFSIGLNVVGNGSMPASTAADWLAASRDPQLVSAGACDPQLTRAGACGTAGYVAMWGNQVVGEAIRQTLATPVEQGKVYHFSACVRDPSASAVGPVRIRVRMSNGPLQSYTTPAVSVGTTTDILTANWTRVTILNWTAPSANLNTITLNPENPQAVDDGTKVSWVHIDNVCLQPADVVQAQKTIAECEKANNCQKCCGCAAHNGQNCTDFKRILW